MMTFSTESDDVPLQWGQILFSQRSRSQKTLSKSAQSTRFSLHRLNSQQKRLLITSLALVNALIIGATISRDQASQVQAVRSVQALVAPTPVFESVEIHPVEAPQAEVASIATEVTQPTPAPTVVPVVAGVSAVRSLSPQVGNWDGLLQQYFGESWVEAKKIMLCESGGNANAINASSGATGLMQIMPFSSRPSQQLLLDPEINIATAAKIHAGQGWRPWSCKTVLGQ